MEPPVNRRLGFEAAPKLSKKEYLTLVFLRGGGYHPPNRLFPVAPRQKKATLGI